MPGPEDQLRSALERLAPPADPAGAYERIIEKKIRRQIYRRLQVAALAIVVLAGTVGGTFVLASVFRKKPPTQQVVGPSAETSVIAFFSDRTALPYEQEIYTIKSDGTGLVRVTKKAMYSTRVSWSPDGAKIAYDQGINEGLSEIVVANADGSDQRILTNVGLPEAPSWSPDGKRIAFYTGLRPQGIYAVDLRGGKPVQLTSSPSVCSDIYPAWSPDGTRIAYLRDCNSGSADVFVMNSDGSGAKRLTNGSVRVNGALTWSPNGTRIAFAVNGEHGLQVAVINVDGSGFEMLTSHGSNTAPAWSPDGNQIAFTSTRDGNREIYVMNANGSSQRNITNSPANDSAPSWQPPRRTIEPSESPTETPSPPEQSESPSPSPSEACAQLESNANGDFDGDGLSDSAVVGPAACLPPAPPPPEGTADYSVRVIYGHGREATYPITACQSVCRAEAVADLNDDGIDEFFIVVDQGASASFLSVFELQNGETAGGLPTTVAKPGAPGFPTDQAAVFEYGGSATHQGFVTCQTSKEGIAEVVATTAALNDQQTEWDAHETVFTFEVVQGEGIPVPLFTVVSMVDYTKAFDPTGIDAFQPHGHACFELDE